MEEERLSARFELLLKRYQTQLEQLRLDLPAPDIEPEPPMAAPPAAAAEPVPLRAAQPYAEPELPVLPLAAAPPAGTAAAARPLAGGEPPRPPAPNLQPEAPPSSVSSGGWEPPRTAEPAPARSSAPAQAGEAIPERKPRPEAISRRPNPAWLAGALAAAALAIAAGWWGYGTIAQRQSYRAFSLPAQIARGLAWCDGRLVVADAQNQNLFFYNEDGGKLAATENLSNPALAALTWADGAFWSTEQGRSAIYQHEPGAEHRVRRIYATPNRRPLALASDGENFWVGDAEVALAYRYVIGRSLNGTLLTPLNQYPLPGAAPAAICAAEGRLWVLDSQSRRLTRYRYDTGTLTAEDTSDLGPVSRITDKDKIVGLALSPSYLWTLTASPPTLHRFALAQLRWEPAVR